MATHEYHCRECGIDRTITANPGEAPPVPSHCGQQMAKRFGFSFAEVRKEIHSGGLGHFDSDRKYRSALSRASDEASERIGRAVTYESFDPRDPGQDPTA